MPHSITLQINPESLNFLNQHKKSLSSAQKIFTAAVKKVHEELACLKEKTLFTFTAENEFELSRGNFYAITESLQKKCPQEKISLENLQAALENDLFISDKETQSFIILCLVEPVWLPGALGLIAYSVLPSTSYICSNQSQPDPLKATISATHQDIIFQFKLSINAITTEKVLPRGTTIIDFAVNNGEVRLLPIQMQFNFQDAQEFIQFQQALTDNFKTWLLHSNELARIQDKLRQAPLLNCDLCVIPSLLGLLTGLIVMVSFIALNLSIIYIFLLPPLGLALGLILAGLAISCAYIDKKREEKKLQRPLYLFNKQFTNPQAPQPTQTFATTISLSL